MDKISIERIQKLHPLVVQPALDAFAEINCALTGKAICRVQEGLRTFETQSDYYALGRTKVNPDGKSKSKPMGNIITNAKAGTSFHQYGLSIDYVLLVDTNTDGKFETPKWDANGDYDGDLKADWNEIANIFIKHGFEWGGNWRTFKDLPHVQMTFGYTWQQLLAKYNAGDFIKGTKYVNIKPLQSNSRKTTVGLNLRSGAGSTYSILKVLPKGTVVDVLEETGAWSKVKVVNSTDEGYVSNQYLSK